MTERRNFYRILGVQPDADADLVRRAYRTWMQKLGVHPDRGGETALAATVNAAYRVLRDPARRAAYDKDLLRQWNRRELAGVRAAAGERSGGEGEMNRRNYYRVLGVQQAAPPAILSAAYATARAATGEPGLVDESWRVLSDPVRRADYDGWLGAAGHAVAARIAAPATHCLFCKTPHAEYPGAGSALRCFNCSAPLSRVAGLPAGDRGRALARAALDAPLALHESWPPRRHDGRLVELTPQGVAVAIGEAIAASSLVRLEAGGFSAVAAVVHCSPAPPGQRCGLKLLRADFERSGLVVDALS